jgi:hypothetical protein
LLVVDGFAELVQVEDLDKEKQENDPPGSI